MPWRRERERAHASPHSRVLCLQGAQGHSGRSQYPQGECPQALPCGLCLLARLLLIYRSLHLIFAFRVALRGPSVFGLRLSVTSVSSISSADRAFISYQPCSHTTSSYAAQQQTVASACVPLPQATSPGTSRVFSTPKSASFSEAQGASLSEVYDNVAVMSASRACSKKGRANTG